MNNSKKNNDLIKRERTLINNKIDDFHLYINF